MKKGTVFIGTAILLVAYCAFHALTWQHLEITDARIFSMYRTVSFAVFGILLLLLIFSSPNDYSGLFSMLIIMATLGTGLLWVFLLAFYPFPEAKKDTRLLYINKQASNRRIIEQTTFAGATGSDRRDTIVIRQLTTNVRWRNEADVSTIDQKEWVPFDK